MVIIHIRVREFILRWQLEGARFTMCGAGYRPAGVRARPAAPTAILGRGVFCDVSSARLFLVP